MKSVIITLIACLAISLCIAQSELKDPSFEEVLSLRQPGLPIISPDGSCTIFTVRTTDWKGNRFDNEIWISKNDQPPFQLTRTTKGSSFSPAWSPDGKWISFLANRGNKTQIFVMRAEGGEAQAITNVKDGIQQYRWSPDGKQIAFRMAAPEKKNQKKRKDRYGAYATDDQEYRLSWLWRIDFFPDQLQPEELPCYDAKDSTAQHWDCLKLAEPEALIDSVDYTITGFDWSPDGKKIAFGHQPNPLINTFFHSDISLLDVTSKTVTPLVKNPSADGFIEWSPDSKQILYSSAESDSTSNYYKNRKLFKIDVASKKSTRLAADFDENFYGAEWTPQGIYAMAYQKMKRNLFLINPNSGNVKEVATSPRFIFGFTISKDGQKLAAYGENGDNLREIYTSPITNINLNPITNFSNQIKGWKVAQSEVISWKSKDGATIEGVLHKPMDYDPNKKYPLLVVIHGGPTGIDRPTPVPAYVYPIIQWLNKGALVLRPNYRGSAGYGEKFRALNVKNLGVGDAWDVLSGVDHLDQKGLIDTDKMGAMGWSQGGYISAFLTTTSNRFKAISVGAGISNWMTYYVNTDIHPFTRQYLKATPWEDEAVYKKTSPMTHINKASTPTLIQHGEFDRRVPIPNAYELLQGLRDVGVPAKLVVYKGFGHGITKPKERLVANWHNWQWFNRYIWGEEVEIPFAEE